MTLHKRDGFMEDCNLGRSKTEGLIVHRIAAALVLCTTIATPVLGASMPAELIGNWSADAPACGNFTIKKDGYLGTADSEGYGCTLQSIKERPSAQHEWTAEFQCSGEDPRPQRLKSLLSLREFEGSALLVVVEQWKTGSDARVLRRCKTAQ